jgi:hypothetical protein
VLPGLTDGGITQGAHFRCTIATGGMQFGRQTRYPVGLASPLSFRGTPRNLAGPSEYLAVTGKDGISSRRAAIRVVGHNAVWRHADCIQSARRLNEAHVLVGVPSCANSFAP